MAQMVPGDQINVALRKQVLLGMFPASFTAAHSHFYYLLFFMTAAGVSLQLCGNMFKAGCCWKGGEGGLSRADQQACNVRVTWGKYKEPSGLAFPGEVGIFLSSHEKVPFISFSS